MNLSNHLTPVVDASFGRLLDILRNRTFGIITAYRGSETKEQNIIRNRHLRARFNERKMGVYQLIGHWEEAPDDMDWRTARDLGLTVDVVERSYVVPCSKDMPEDEFVSFLIECMTIDGLTQDSFVLHDDSGYYLVYSDGDRDLIGTNVSLNKLSQAYSRSVLAQDLPFVFDSIRQPNGNSDRMAMQRQGLLWLGPERKVDARVWRDGEVRSVALRDMLDAAGWKDVFLCKGDGYFYVNADDTGSEAAEKVLRAYDTDIYLNSFRQQSVQDWFDDIRRIIEG